MVAVTDSRDEYGRSPPLQSEEHRPADKGPPVDVSVLNSLSVSRMLRNERHGPSEWRTGIDPDVGKVFGDLLEVLQRLPPSKSGEGFAMFDSGGPRPMSDVSRETTFICYGDLSKEFSVDKSVFALHIDRPSFKPGEEYDTSTPPSIIVEQGSRGPAAPPNVNAALNLAMESLASCVPQRMEDIRKGLEFLTEERKAATKAEAPPKPREIPVIAPR